MPIWIAGVQGAGAYSTADGITVVHSWQDVAERWEKACVEAEARIATLEAALRDAGATLDRLLPDDGSGPGFMRTYTLGGVERGTLRELRARLGGGS